VWGINTQHQQTPNYFSSAQTVISPNVRGELSLDEWQFNADSRFDYGDVFGNHQVFSLGVNRALVQDINIFVNGGTGYRQPGVNELLHPVYGNKSLKGESNTGGEIGLSWHPLPESEIKVSGYYQNYRQMITLQLDSKTGLVKAVNVSEADVWGTEMQAKHRWSSNWESGLNYSYMDATNPITHLRVANRPEHQGVFWNEVQLFQPLKLRTEFNVHSGYWFDAANTFRANPAPRLNVLLKYQLMPKTELYLRGENVTNERTSELNNFGFNGAAVYFGIRTGF
jgi:outer membrane cobalamin receptor